MERSFKQEVQSLRLGVGDTFHGEGILAVTKALLQSGVSYVSGYPGAPVSHLVDVLTDASDILDDLGIYFAPAANCPASALVRQKSVHPESPSERIVKNIRRATRKRHSSEEKIRIVLDGLRGESSIAELCRREGIAESLYPAFPG